MTTNKLIKNIRRYIKIKPCDDRLCTLTSFSKSKEHSITVNHIFLLDNDSIVVCDVYMKKTVHNIKNNSDVVLTIWAAEDEKSKENEYEIHGKAKYYKQGPEIQKLKDKCKEKDKDLKIVIKGVIVVKINNIEII